MTAERIPEYYPLVSAIRDELSEIFPQYEITRQGCFINIWSQYITITFISSKHIKVYNYAKKSQTAPWTE